MVDLKIIYLQDLIFFSITCYTTYKFLLHTSPKSIIFVSKIIMTENEILDKYIWNKEYDPNEIVVDESFLIYLIRNTWNEAVDACAEEVKDKPYLKVISSPHENKNSYFARNDLNEFILKLKK